MEIDDEWWGMNNAKSQLLYFFSFFSFIVNQNGFEE